MRREDRSAAEQILRCLIRLGKQQTMKEIYERLEPSPKDGRIRSWLSPVGTETGRFSHSKSWLEVSTNLGNLPKKTALVDPVFRVRECIIAPEGRLLGKADYSSAEARWCAWIAGDEKRIQMYEQGIDQYRVFVAALKYDDPTRTEDVSKVERDVIGKVGILSGQYRVGWRTLMESCNEDADIHGVYINAKEAQKMVAIWPELFPRTVQWWQEVGEEVLTKGFLVNPFGRKRVFFGRRDSEAAVNALVREAIAYLPQSANADALNSALATLHEQGFPDLVLQVHDELVWEVDEPLARKSEEAVRRAMEVPYEVNGRSLTIPCEVKFGKNWADMAAL